MSFELHLTRNALNFESVLNRLEASSRVMIASYGLGKASSDNPLLSVLKALPRGKDVTIITAIPNRRAPWANENAVQSSDEIDQFIETLDPNKFDCSVSAWFCTDNHAKIVLCDDVAYVGSANLTRGSSFNFEAGCTFRDKVKLKQVEDFFELLLKGSIPYLNLQRSTDLLKLFKFWSSISALLVALEDHASDWHVDMATGDGELVFSADRFSIPPNLIAAIKEALATVHRIDEAATNRSEADKPDPAFEFEDRFAKERWNDYLEELLNDADLINEHKIFAAPFHADAEAEDLVEEMIGSEPDVTVLMKRADFQHELHDQRERHEERRNRKAREAYDDFRRSLDNLRSMLRDAFVGLGLNPAIRRAPKKYP